MEKKINDFYQNAEIHDMQCIAYAYRPINTNNGSRIPFLNPDDDKNEDPGCAFVVLPYKPPSNDSSSSSSSSSDEISSDLSSVSPPVKNTGSMSASSSSSDNSISDTDYSFEDDEPVDEQEEETFYKEVVKGQIFLGMAAMCHQPKQVAF
jgi:hypothetical protein